MKELIEASNKENALVGAFSGHCDTSRKFAGSSSVQCGGGGLFVLTARRNCRVHGILKLMTHWRQSGGGELKFPLCHCFVSLQMIFSERKHCTESTWYLLDPLTVNSKHLAKFQCAVVDREARSAAVMCKVQSLIVAPEPRPAFVTIKYSCHHCEHYSK